MTYRIAAFYRFVALADISALKSRVLNFAQNHPTLCGTILLAPEGINGTIGAHPESLAAAVNFLDQNFGIAQGELKYSQSMEKPFNRFKVRPKKEIITMRRPEADPTRAVGTYATPQQWNALINDPEVVLIDTRNTYETEIGVFENALDPKLSTFSEFPAWVDAHLNPTIHKKIAMYCTGGIRCEKASSYMLARGFEQVYHLKGGILQYLEDVPKEQSRWNGECFVFDKRTSVVDGLAEGKTALCFGCRAPLSKADRADNRYEAGVSCPRCADGLTPVRADSLRARHRDFMDRHT